MPESGAQSTCGERPATAACNRPPRPLLLISGPLPIPLLVHVGTTAHSMAFSSHSAKSHADYQSNTTSCVYVPSMLWTFFAPPRTPPHRGKNLRELLILPRSHESLVFAIPLKRAGSRIPEDWWLAPPPATAIVNRHPGGTIQAAGPDRLARPCFFFLSSPNTTTESRLGVGHLGPNPLRRGGPTRSSRPLRPTRHARVHRCERSRGAFPSSQESVDTHWRHVAASGGAEGRPVPRTALLER